MTFALSIPLGLSDVVLGSAEGRDYIEKWLSDKLKGTPRVTSHAKNARDAS